MNSSGRHRAADRVPPADQRLHPGRLPVRQEHLGLELQLELAPVDAAAQIPEQREPRRGIAVGIGDVPLHPAPAFLGQVHRHVGVLHQQLEAGRVVGVHRDADARLDLERHAFQPDRLGHRGAQPGGDLAGRADLPDRRQQHGELVAAEPRDHVARPDAVRQPVRHQPQQPVADRVPQRVVDLLEPVQVEQQEADLGGPTWPPGPALRSVCRHQQLAVGQPGQLVMVGLVLALHRDRGVDVDRRQREREQHQEQRRAAHHDRDQRRGRQQDELTKAW